MVCGILLPLFSHANGFYFLSSKACEIAVCYDCSVCEYSLRGRLVGLLFVCVGCVCVCWRGAWEGCLCRWNMENSNPVLSALLFFLLLFNYCSVSKVQNEQLFPPRSCMSFKCKFSVSFGVFDTHFEYHYHIPPPPISPFSSQNQRGHLVGTKIWISNGSCHLYRYFSTQARNRKCEKWKKS